MNEGREAFRKQLMALREHYQVALPERIEAVRQAATEVVASDGAATQVTALYQLVHNLAGSGATFGYHEVSEIARQFQTFIQSLVASGSGLTARQRDQLQAYWVLLEGASALAESSRGPLAGCDHRLEPSRSLVPAGSEKLIFLVEDDQDLAFHLEYALRQFGYTVRLFPELQGLGEAVARTSPLAILMDMTFPEGDLAGAEIIHAINAEREEPIAVIFISVRDDFDARLHAVRTGNTHYLAKPLDIPALARILDEVVLAQPAEPYRVLIVEDDAELAAFYQLHLEQAGMTVFAVTDPREALAAIPQIRAELVLMDVHMPFCSGLELAAVIRQCEEYTGIAIVFLSTETDLDRQLAAAHLGGDDFLTKPIEGWHLVRSIQARVKRSRDLRLAKERLASQALRQGEERFRLAIESAPCGMAMIDRAGHIVMVNAQAETLFGYTRSELIGQPLDLLVPEGSRDRHRIYVRQFFNDPKTRSMASRREVQGRHKDSREIPIEIGLSLFQTGEGPLGLSTIVDITERKRAEEALKTADRRKDEFLAILAHELRNPLAPIRNGLLALRKSGGQAAVAQRVQGIMERQVDHLVRLVDDLLEVSRISEGKIELRKEQVDLATVINHAVDMNKDSIDAAVLRLGLILPGEPLIVDGDPVRLGQVVANLLNNAVKYTDRGGRIEVTAWREGDTAILSVADNGMGIRTEMLSCIFDLFSQVNGALGRGQGGLGIGLALAKKLVELHGGTVEAQSDGEGRGSSFIVRLPVSIAARRDQFAPRNAPRMDMSSHRVLVIDDTVDVADSLGLLLETLGVNVRIAYGGAEGLEACAGFEPEVVFLDVGMPEMDGFETARRLRELPAGRNAILVALTGWGEEKTRRKVSEAGFDAHLTKPADIGELEALLDSAPQRQPG